MVVAVPKRPRIALLQDATEPLLDFCSVNECIAGVQKVWWHSKVLLTSGELYESIPVIVALIFWVHVLSFEFDTAVSVHLWISQMLVSG